MNQTEIKAAGFALMLRDTEGKYPRSFPSEDHFQTACIVWANKHFRHISVLHSVPNGGNLHPLERNKFIATGLMSGAADLELKWAGGRLAHLELKNGERKLDPKQAIFKIRIEQLGHLYYQVNTFFEFVVVTCYCLNVNPHHYL